MWSTTPEASSRSCSCRPSSLAAPSWAKRRATVSRSSATSPPDAPPKRIAAWPTTSTPASGAICALAASPPRDLRRRLAALFRESLLPGIQRRGDSLAAARVLPTAAFDLGDKAPRDPGKRRERLTRDPHLLPPPPKRLSRRCVVRSRCGRRRHLGARSSAAGCHRLTGRYRG